MAGAGCACTRHPSWKPATFPIVREHLEISDSGSEGFSSCLPKRQRIWVAEFKPLQTRLPKGSPGKRVCFHGGP